MKVGLLVAGPKIASKIKTSYNIEYGLTKNNKSIAKLVVFDPLKHELFRDFDYSESDWGLIFDEYESFPSIDLIPSILVRSIIRIDTKFSTPEFAKAIDKQYNKLTPDVAHKFLNHIWQLSFYSAKIYHKEIVSVLSKYDPKYNYKSEKSIIADAIKYCQEVVRSSNNHFKQGVFSFEL